MGKKKKLGLVPKLIIGIILGILIGSFCPEIVCRIVVTASGLFSTFLKFVIPMMILAYVTMGIADLSQGAGKLLAITAGLSYGSTLIAGSCAFLVAITLFPSFMDASALEQIAATAGNSVASLFSISVTPILDTLAAVLLAFILGLSLSAMKGKEIGDTLYNAIKDFSTIIDKVLHVAIVPLLPLYICGTFVDMTHSGKTFVILGILWKVFLVVIAMHLLYLVFAFVVAGGISHKNPVTLLKNQIPGYTYHRPGHPVLRRHHPGEPPVRRGGRYLPGDPQLRGAPVCQHPHGRLHDHHHLLCHCGVFDERSAHQPGYGGPLHCHPGYRDGGFSRCAGRLYYDRASLPVHGVRT